VIVTDKFNADERTGLVSFHKDQGTRAYYCGEKNGQPELIWALSDAVKYESFEAAEVRILLLAIWIPALIDHMHVVTEHEALKQWTEDLDEFTKKLESQRSLRDNGGCF
jgi:hypothetical protein